MKNLRILLSGVIFLSLIISAYSQSNDKLWLVDEIVVKPEQLANFEKSQKKINQFFKDNNYPYEIQVYSSTGFKFYSFRRLESIASYDEVISATSDCWSKIDRDIYNNYVQCFSSDKKFIMKEKGKYTYRPEQQRIEWSEINYGIWDVHYVKSDKIKEYFEVIEEFNILIKKHGFDDPIIMLQGMLGTENPMYAWTLVGKDANDMMQQNKIMMEEMVQIVIIRQKQRLQH